MTAPTITKETMAELICQLTGQNKAHLMATLTDEQVAGFAADIATVLSPEQVFPADAITGFAERTDDLYTRDEALAFAASLDPDAVYADAPGVAKLDAWAIAAGYSKS